MLSKITNFINPPPAKGEAVERADQKNHDRGGGKKDDSPAEQEQDDTCFSIDAIRALLKQQNVTVGDDVLAYLDLLKQHGIVSISIRNEQSIIAAITDAAARLVGK